LSRDAIKRVGAIETAWEGPVSFSFNADVDFHGGYISSVLHDAYVERISKAKEREEIGMLLALYTEDVNRVIENEVYHARLGIIERYPEASYIDLRPHSTLNKRSALDQLQYSKDNKI